MKASRIVKILDFCKPRAPHRPSHVGTLALLQYEMTSFATPHKICE
jgi:hypothetical protein